MNRRNFISKSSLTAAGTIGIGTLSASFLSSCGSSSKMIKSGAFMPGFSQSPLAYGYKDLEPYIDALTMEIHYTKHAAAYTRNMSEAIEMEKLGGYPLETLLSKISKYSAALRNNAGGHYNHESFWKWMTPGGKKISTEFTKVIEQQFSSVVAFQNEFNAAAGKRFGSGWAWLVLDKNKQLKITSTSNQDNPLMDIAEVKGFPLLGLDVWEHAYYLKYQNKRADYVSNWWNIVNWDEVEKRFKSAIS